MHRCEACVFDSERGIHEADDVHEELRTSRRQGNSDNVVVLERRFLLSVAKAVALVDELDTVLVELGSQRGVQRVHGRHGPPRVLVGSSFFPPSM